MSFVKGNQDHHTHQEQALALHGGAPHPAAGAGLYGPAPWGHAGEGVAYARLRRQLAAVLRCWAPPASSPVSAHPAFSAQTYATHDDPAGPDATPLDSLDWTALLALARAERLDALLYIALLGVPTAPTCSSTCPPAVRAALEAAYWRTKVANLLALDAVDQFTGALEAIDVPFVLLKGAALAFTLYTDAARRPIGDIDILVHPEHVAVALRVLALLGYAPAPGGPAAAIAARVAAGDARTLQRHCEVTMLRSVGAAHQLPMQVDLHWSLNCRTLLRRTMDAAWFWDHTRLFLAGPGARHHLRSRLRVLGDEAQLLHLCAHTLQHGIPRLRWTYDMAYLIARRFIDWEVVLEGAARCRLSLAVQSSLAAVALVWGIAPPSWVEERLAALPVSGAELRLRRATWSGDGRMVAACDLLSQPSLSSALDLWLAAVLPPAAYLESRYKIANSHLLPAYYLLHAVRGTVLGSLGALRLLGGVTVAPEPEQGRSGEAASDA